ncbi:anti-sigma factor family protein [Spongiactinospora sp. 9N601]|uniref:anti-sigma factor family protein n=1 Tax=Spongiactinospora sp. 9N601 TaxID=3375149 RepID=UPI0037A7F687
MMRCEEVRLSLGAHALRALDADEAVVVEAHLAECGECRAEYDELVGVTAFLGRVSAGDVAQAVRPPRAVLDRMLDAGVRRRRRSRVLLAAAAAAVVVAGGGVVVTTITNTATTQEATSLSARDSGAEEVPGEAASDAVVPKAAPDDSAALAQQVPALTMRGKDGKISGQVRVFAEENGSRVEVSLDGMPPGARCDLIAVGADDTKKVAGGAIAAEARYTSEADYSFTGNTSLTPSEIERFEVVDAAGRLLLTLEGP